MPGTLAELKQKVSRLPGADVRGEFAFACHAIEHLRSFARTDADEDPRRLPETFVGICARVSLYVWTDFDSEVAAFQHAFLDAVAGFAVDLASRPTTDRACSEALSEVAITIATAATAPDELQSTLAWLDTLAHSGSIAGEVAAARGLLVLDVERWQKRSIADAWMSRFSAAGLDALAQFRRSRDGTLE